MSAMTLARRVAAAARRDVPLHRVRPGEPALVAYPLDLNPYQELLYGPLRGPEHGYVIEYVRRRSHLGPLPFLFGIAWARARGYRLVHVHWPRFELRRGERRLYRLSLANALLSLWWLQALGMRVVWTVHNSVPHEPETSDDARVTRLLARAAARKIVHSAQTISELAALGADVDRVTVIPHGSYVGQYPEAERGCARRELALPGDARIVLFFGQLRPYKGVDDLLAAWPAAAAAVDGDPPPFVLVAGKCDDHGQRAQLQRATSDGGGRLDEGYVDAGRLPLYFAAADIVALPFRTVTTSGSALLALSLGRPVLAPRLGALRDLPEDVGLFYEPGALQDALRRALTAPDHELADRGRRARTYAEGISWERIAEATAREYRRALGG